MSRRYWGIIGCCCVIGLLFFFWAENNISKSFEQCVAYERHQQSTNNANKYRFIIGRIFARQAVCTVMRLDSHAGFITAVGGLIVALFSFTLSRSTKKLWIAGEKAAEQTTKAINTAAKANEIAERSIVEQNRPWVFVKNLIWEPEKSYISIVFFNSGATPARQFKKTISGLVLPVPFPSAPLPEPDKGYSSFLAPGASEILTIEKPEAMPEGYEYRIWIAIAYTLQNGSIDTLYEDYACSSDGHIRKITPKDYAAYNGEKTYTIGESYPIPK